MRMTPQDIQDVTEEYDLPELPEQDEDGQGDPAAELVLFRF